MRNGFLIILCLLLATKGMAQCELLFNNEHVVSVSFVDYTEKAHGDSCMLLYIDSRDHLMAKGRPVCKNSGIYKEALTEMQHLFDEIGRNRIPSAEDFGITVSVMKKKFNRKQILLKYYQLYQKPSKKGCDSILIRYQSLDAFNGWLQKTYPVIDDGAVVINTAHDPCGMKIIIQTDKKTYYFDMRDIEKFQPYLMRTSDKDCLKFLTNFNVNKYLRNLYKTLKINRTIPWSDEVIDLYIISCAEEYRLQ